MASALWGRGGGDKTELWGNFKGSFSHQTALPSFPLASRLCVVWGFGERVGRKSGASRPGVCRPRDPAFDVCTRITRRAFTGPHPVLPFEAPCSRPPTPPVGGSRIKGPPYPHPSGPRAVDTSAPIQGCPTPHWRTLLRYFPCAFGVQAIPDGATGPCLSTQVRGAQDASRPDTVHCAPLLLTGRWLRMA